MMQLHEAAALISGAVLVGDAQVPIDRVHTDTRSLQAADLFVALKGESFDANRFLAEAASRGAAAAICHPGSGLAQSGLPGLEVPDTKLALGQLGSGWRARFTLPLIAVTGSNGKTTVTQMIGAILRASVGDAALSTQGNLNNDIGVPLTLLRLRASHPLAVLERGINHPGEIATLAAMARPSVALVNNAHREHLEFMGSVEAVALENGAVLAALPAPGVAVFPHDDLHTPLWRRLAAGRCQHSFQAGGGGALRVQVSCAPPCWIDGAWQVQAKTPAGALHFALRVPGRHNVHNALAAATCALAAGVPLAAVQRGLESFESVQGRSRAISLRIGDTMHTLIDDSYNANPDSVAAALELLASLPAPRLMVLGDMAEVGHHGEQFHAQAGALADELGIEHVFTHGALSAATSRANRHARHFEDMPTLIAAVIEELPGVSSVLVKGSRFMRMERVVEAVTTVGTPPAKAPNAS
ncbi:MAG: UDP-N-acetylmuramoyl-tripeptide--D-alanyl-D-alanine ligase [Rhodoferax sp.]|nr:UDP-N-acetylmuramoyl-tripeptide--D-alanyl-D-alanine ligase [Rhodoferax sp.]